MMNFAYFCLLPYRASREMSNPCHFLSSFHRPYLSILASLLFNLELSPEDLAQQSTPATRAVTRPIGYLHYFQL